MHVGGEKPHLELALSVICYPVIHGGVNRVFWCFIPSAVHRRVALRSQDSCLSCSYFCNVGSLRTSSPFLSLKRPGSALWGQIAQGLKNLWSKTPNKTDYASAIIQFIAVSGKASVFRDPGKGILFFSFFFFFNENSFIIWEETFPSLVYFLALNKK